MLVNSSCEIQTTAEKWTQSQWELAEPLTAPYWPRSESRCVKRPQTSSSRPLRQGQCLGNTAGFLVIVGKRETSLYKKWLMFKLKFCWIIWECKNLNECTHSTFDPGCGPLWYQMTDEWSDVINPGTFTLSAVWIQSALKGRSANFYTTALWEYFWKVPDLQRQFGI